MYRKMMENITAGGSQHSNGYSLPEDLERVVSDLVGRIEHLFRDEPYGRTVDRIFKGEGPIFHGKQTGDPINVIPGEGIAACTSVTLAVSTGNSRSREVGFPAVMRAVREYLIDCESMAKVVVLLTDSWTPRDLQEHLGDVWAHARQERFIVPHLVTGNRIVRVDWPRQ